MVLRGGGGGVYDEFGGTGELERGMFRPMSVFGAHR